MVTRTGVKNTVATRTEREATCRRGGQALRITNTARGYAETRRAGQNKNRIPARNKRKNPSVVLTVAHNGKGATPSAPRGLLPYQRREPAPTARSYTPGREASRAT